MPTPTGPALMGYHFNLGNLQKAPQMPPLPPVSDSNSGLRTLVKILSATALVSLGVGLAFALYQWAGNGQFFSWTVATAFSPLVAVSIGGVSAFLVGIWLLTSLEKFKMWRGSRLLISMSLIWLGFGAGLFGPGLIGREASWSASNLNNVQSVVYTIDFDYVELPPELSDFWSGATPGPYITTTGDKTFVAVNSSGPPRINSAGEASGEGGEVLLGLVSPGVGGGLQGVTNLTEIDSRVQHLRDLQPYNGGLVFSNVELKTDCIVLQVWTAKLSADSAKVVSVEHIWESQPCLDPSMSPEGRANALQSGARIAVEDDGSVLLSVGDFRLGLSIDQEFEGRPDPLGPRGSYGKILRIQQDGSSDVVSAGHRNPQGLFLDSATSRLWSSEHGPNAGGELNLIIEGADYGWPDTTYGVPYGSKLPGGDWQIGRWASDHEGYEKPVLAWMPSIAPSQVIVYQGEHFPAWKGDILLAALLDQSLRRIRLDGDRVVFDERIEIGERVRDLVELEDGRLLLSFDSGQLGILSLPEIPQ